MKKFVFASFLAVLLLGLTSCADSLNQMILEGSSNTSKSTCPTNFVAEQIDFGVRKVKLSWNSVRNADGYKVYKCDSNDFANARLIGEVTYTSCIYEAQSMYFNTSYHFFVTAVFGKKESDYTHKTVKLYDMKPDEPYSVHYEREDNLSVMLKWDEVTFADKYYVYQKDGHDYVKLDEVTDSCIKISKSKTGTYTFAVKAVFDNGRNTVEGYISDDISIAFKKIDLEAKPEKFTGSFKADSNNILDYVSLSWNKVPEADEYELWMADSFSPMDESLVDMIAEKLADTKTNSIDYSFDNVIIYINSRYLYFIVRPVYYTLDKNDKVYGEWSKPIYCHSKK